MITFFAIIFENTSGLDSVQLSNCSCLNFIFFPLLDLKEVSGFPNLHLI